MSYPQQPVPRRSNKAPIIGFFVIILLAAGFFVFLSGNAVLDVANKGGFTGSGTVLSKKTRGGSCILEVRREDGVKENRSAGFKRSCGKYEVGQKVHYTQGIID